MRHRLFAVLTLAAASVFAQASTSQAALPPTPPEQMAAAAQGAVTAVVVATAWTGPKLPAPPKRPTGWVGPIPDVRAQKVTLKIVEVVRWPKGVKAPKVGTTLVVTKPIQPYEVKVSTQTSMFLLDMCTPTSALIGRYGTAEYDVESLRTVLDQVPAHACP